MVEDTVFRQGQRLQIRSEIASIRKASPLPTVNRPPMAHIHRNIFLQDFTRGVLNPKKHLRSLPRVIVVLGLDLSQSAAAQCVRVLRHLVGTSRLKSIEDLRSQCEA